jgi:protein-disulfide isomerase-like protein with CxxC motif
VCSGPPPEAATLVGALPPGWTVRLACGGLVTGERVRAVRHDAEYLRAGLARVAEVTGRHAGAAFFDGLLADGEYVSDSEPPTRALWVATQMAADHLPAIAMSHRLSDAFYLDGRRPGSPDTIRDAAAAAGLDGDELLGRWSTDEARDGTQRWWRESRMLGVTTYPSYLVRADAGERPVVLAEGAVSADRILAALAGA